MSDNRRILIAIGKSLLLFLISITANYLTDDINVWILGIAGQTAILYLLIPDFQWFWHEMNKEADS